jgi:hypothetical protein
MPIVTQLLLGVTVSLLLQDCHRQERAWMAAMHQEGK